MNDDGTGLAYKDQATAEGIAAERRWAHVMLLNDLEELNKTLDSLKLHKLIARERERLS